MTTAEKHDEKCLFCNIIKGNIPSVQVHEDDKTYAFMDIMPQSEGHTLVIPKYHTEDFFDLPIEWAQACLATAQKLATAAKSALAPEGTMIMQLNGAAAGQTVFHYHIHVIPRWADRPLAQHAREMTDAAVLEPIAAKIRAVL
ncbi:MAG: HIT family protein [Alphaproteobacteria bacterium]